MSKSCDVDTFLFSQHLTFSSPTRGCYQEWNNLGVRLMMVEIMLRLARNIIFIVVDVVAHCKVSVFTTQVTFYIRNQDPLLMDICLL